jgi:hypothetical protein
MKKIFSVIIICSCFLFSQETEQKHLLHLKNEIKTFSENPNFKLASQNLVESQKKSTGLAIIYSLLLPGMGELYAESYESGKYFTIADGVLWGTYIGINTYGNWQEDRYKSYAEVNAGVNIQGKNDDYFSTISEYLSIEQYNNEKALERNFDEMLDENKYFWKWTSEDRKTYRSMWVSSEQSYNSLRFVVGALIINRIASAINAVRLVSAHNKQQADELSWSIFAGVENTINLPNNFTINFQKSF